MRYYRKVFLIVCLLGLKVSSSLAQEKLQSEYRFQTILFEVRSEDHTSYLFGTHHAFGESFFHSLNGVEQKLLDSRLVILESLNTPEESTETIINKREKTTDWKRYLSKNDVSFIEEIFQKSQVDWHKITPAEMYQMLGRIFKERYCQAKADSDAYYSLDGYIGWLAEQNQIQQLGLETREQQLLLINQDVTGMPRKVHKRRLKSIIDAFESGASSRCDETDWYRSMNMDYQLENPCGNALLLTDRNNQWMPELIQAIETKDCFIAVGLSHLMFDCGLIHQLQVRGYEISPITFDSN